MKSVATHQPNYIPWLGYFYKIYQSDVFVFLDDVQFSKRGLHNYHFLKTQEGPVRMRIPVINSYYDNINVVKIRNEGDWQKKHLELIHHNYKNAPFFDEVYIDFEKLIITQHEYLVDLNISIIEFYCNKLGIQYSFLNSSDLCTSKNREERIIDICKILRADIYYSGTGAKTYQNEDDFQLNGIQLKYSDYKVFEYPQQFSDFQSNVSILDFLMNCGYNWELVLKNQN